MTTPLLCVKSKCKVAIFNGHRLEASMSWFFISSLIMLLFTRNLQHSVVTHWLLHISPTLKGWRLCWAGECRIWVTRVRGECVITQWPPAASTLTYLFFVKIFSIISLSSYLIAILSKQGKCNEVNKLFHVPYVAHLLVRWFEIDVLIHRTCVLQPKSTNFDPCKFYIILEYSLYFILCDI